MTVRAKMQLQEIRQSYGNTTAKTLIFRTSYDQSIPEDQRFYKATPYGEFSMMVDNPVALAVFKLGDYYYLDMTPVNPL